jgi:hypothetical protein
MAEQLLAGLKMLNEKYGGEIILMPGDACRGHWDTPQFIKGFNPALTPAEAILQAGDHCYTGMVNAFKEAGYPTILMAVGDHEVGDNPWPVGTAVSKHQAEFRQTFARGFNIDPDGAHFRYDKPIGAAASRPLGTKYETTSYAYQYKNVLFVTVDVFYQEDPDKQIGPQGSVTGSVVGKHLQWFDHVLSEARKVDSIKHIFVQAHLPVLQSSFKPTSPCSSPSVESTAAACSWTARWKVAFGRRCASMRSISTLPVKCIPTPSPRIPSRISSRSSRAADG